jgi:hypothetical protein
MHRLDFEPARPIDTEAMPWIPAGPGKSFRPLRSTWPGAGSAPWTRSRASSAEVAQRTA